MASGRENAARCQGLTLSQLRAITRKSLFSETPLIGEIEQTEQRQHSLYGNGLRRTLTYGKNGQAECLTLTPALQFQYRFDADGHLAELTPAGSFNKLKR